MKESPRKYLNIFSNIFLDAIHAANENRSLPLHFACYNENVKLNIVQLLFDAAAKVKEKDDKIGKVFKLRKAKENAEANVKKALQDNKVKLKEKDDEIDALLGKRNDNDEALIVDLEQHHKTERMKNERSERVGGSELDCSMRMIKLQLKLKEKDDEIDKLSKLLKDKENTEANTNKALQHITPW